jgi:hypothetical protein
MRRSVPGLSILLLALGALGTCAASGTDEPVGRPVPAPVPARPSPSPTGPRVLSGTALATPTRLHLLAPGRLFDVDSGTNRPVPIDSWLPTAGAAPLLLSRAAPATELGTVSVTDTWIAADLPTSPRVVQVTVPATAVLAAAGDGLRAAEYLSRTRCQLRKLALDGRPRRPARPVACGTRPIVESSHGLWVSRGPDAFVAATRSSSNADYTYVLLDAATLAEKLSYPEVRVIDDHRVITMDDAGHEPVLRDLRSPAVTPLRWPGYSPSPTIGRVSPDGRYAIVLFEDPSRSPQVMDVWLLHLYQGVWLHVPATPAATELKATDVGWSVDGRLVLCGRFPGAGDLLATWRPGDATLAVRPFALPDNGIGGLLAW